MTLLDKAKLALEGGNLSASRKLLKKHFEVINKLEWDNARINEYDDLYRTVEVTQDVLDENTGETTNVSIGYELVDNAPNYFDWLNETRLVSEVVYYTYQEYLTKAEEFNLPVVDEAEYENIKQIKTPEVKKYVRPYPYEDVTDTVEAYINSQYAELRKNEYLSIGEQLDMLYKDMKNGSQEWLTHIDVIKTKYPKPS